MHRHYILYHAQALHFCVSLVNKNESKLTTHPMTLTHMPVTGNTYCHTTHLLIMQCNMLCQSGHKRLTLQSEKVCHTSQVQTAHSSKPLGGK
jgi:hypothetical protein